MVAAPVTLPFYPFTSDRSGPVRCYHARHAGDATAPSTRVPQGEGGLCFLRDGRIDAVGPRAKVIPYREHI